MTRSLFGMIYPGILLLLSACANPSESPDSVPVFDFATPDDSLEAISLLYRPLYRSRVPGERDVRMKAQLEDARAHLENNPSSVDGFVWYGRRLAYLGRYRDAIEVFTRGLERFPNEPHLLRHRGHRYITTRQFVAAIDDFKAAVDVVAGHADEVEPDGLPNASGIPTSSLQTNIWYHLGLAHYLRGEFNRAAEAFQECFDLATNDDMRVASADWLYMSLRRDNSRGEAEEAIKFVREDMELLENSSYLQRLLLYRGLSDDAGLAAATENGSDALSVATLGYGVGNWHLMEGDKTRAFQIFEAVLETGSWAAFGFIASEAESARSLESQK